MWADKACHQEGAKKMAIVEVRKREGDMSPGGRAAALLQGKVSPLQALGHQGLQAPVPALNPPSAESGSQGRASDTCVSWGTKPMSLVTPKQQC